MWPENRYSQVLLSSSTYSTLKIHRRLTHLFLKRIIVISLLKKWPFASESLHQRPKDQMFDTRTRTRTHAAQVRRRGVDKITTNWSSFLFVFFSFFKKMLRNVPSDFFALSTKYKVFLSLFRFPERHTPLIVWKMSFVTCFSMILATILLTKERTLRPTLHQS